MAHQLMRSNATTDSKQTLPDKVAIYEWVCALNLHFKDVLLDLERLTTLGIFRSRFQRDSIKTCRAMIEETQAWINFEVTETLQDCEDRDRTRFELIRHQLENKYRDRPSPSTPAAKLRRASKESIR